MRGVLLAFTALLLVPVSAGQRDLILGTEDVPELPDAAGDVKYGSAYVGERNHTYVDFQAAWFNFTEEIDEIVFTIKTGDAQYLRSPPTGYRIYCRVNGTIGEWKLNIDWVRPVTQSNLTSSVIVGGAGFSQVLEHSFSAELADPGYFRFSIPRFELLQFGDEFAMPRGLCLELVDAGGFVGFPEARFTANQPNWDEAQSNATYSFREGMRLRDPDGEPTDPVEKFERETAMATPSMETSYSDNEGAPALGFAVLVSVVICSALALRKSRGE